MLEGWGASKVIVENKSGEIQRSFGEEDSDLGRGEIVQEWGAGKFGLAIKESGCREQGR